MVFLRTSQENNVKAGETGRKERNMNSPQYTSDEWVEELGSHCTLYVQLAFICSCLSIFVGGIFFILIFRIIHYTLRWYFYAHPGSMQMITSRHPLYLRWKGKFQDWVVMMLSAQTSVGRVLVILVFLFSIGSLIIYIMNCYSVKQFCLSFEDHTVILDLFFNTFFLFYFGLRFLAAGDKLTFWLELNSIVDFFTITPVCVSSYLNRNWLGLRFLRALRLLELPKILQFLHITTSGTAIKLSKLLAVFISTWLTAAGFLHWIENSGDPWAQERNFQNLSYFDCLYLIMVTMSTVGYGDIVVRTTLGRIFILFFIIGGLILFANLVPEMVDIVGSTKIYKGSYEAVKGRKYLIVCGDITLHSVTAFLRDFLTQDTGEVTTEIVFLGENAPCLELETVFRCYAAYATFFQGSVMVYEDLSRVQIYNAEACLILADTCSPHPYIEDTSNIMRVLSIKNHYPDTRVIIQIIQSSNKVYLPKIPSWDWRNGDSIICFAELKLGLIAQSCLVPGLTTLLTSLFIREDSQKVSTLLKHHLDIEGKEYKVMTQLLSNDFINMSFQELCRLCFVKLNLMLVAVEIRSGICANRARYYCRLCHSDILNPDLIGICRCKRKKLSPAEKPEHQGIRSWSLGILPFTNLDDIDRAQGVQKKQSDPLLDSTGMFHWCEAVPFEQAILKRQAKLSSTLKDHIVVCVFGDATSALIGLRNFVMPLRASNFAFAELKDIIFVGALEYLQREWEFIHNFPKLHLLKGSALSCADLISANIKNCATCVILSAHARGLGDQTLVDTKSILATLNIRSLQFKTSVDEFSRLTLGNTSRSIFWKKIPIITELKIASNAQFFEQSSKDPTGQPRQSPTCHLPKGTIFSDSFLDSLLCTTYHNHLVLALLQTLVTGGTSPELEEYLSQESSLSGSASNVMHHVPRNRCKLALIPVTDDPLSMEGLLLCFGDLYTKALDMYGILCFGVYRLREEPNPYELRKVDCN